MHPDAYPFQIPLQHPSDDGLVLHMPLQEGTGGVVYDLSGKEGNNGTLYGPTWVYGPNGWVLDYDGSSYVEVNGLVDDIQNNTKGTITAWFLVNDIGTSYAIFNASDSGDPNSWLFMYVHSNERVFVGCYEAEFELYNRRIASPNLVANRWYHAAMTQDGTTVRGYINGVEYPISPPGMADPSAWFNTVGDIDDISVGSHITSGGRELYMNGKVGEVLVYSRWLSSAEIKRLYEEGRP